MKISLILMLVIVGLNALGSLVWVMFDRRKKIWVYFITSVILFFSMQIIFMSLVAELD